MNENQIRSSLQLMDELQQQPIWDVFENIDSKLAADEANHPYSFDQIRGRLEKKIIKILMNGLMKCGTLFPYMQIFLSKMNSNVI
ncbi:hypothetical protein TVAG_205830 [Trichomonas vaginalis G3]|uniref:Uncharacterized protein n=1 Tax=Trichomonas vaginalis (strain ATCC PRA-98 / G3) TaxID=412133 RepID=A2FW42_TRIV3|nr:hypothetical protein TVAGG3_0159170 [Trichomonas vaginalis G3]EAX90863.1 hypothetical protein TVAG_205830 [Trichomonas vaginalis G3]KAI5547736.1 hypothetical protein TVAGG3_0159170 [Trichomonas vaginalis G3]|eukprot:XP_001303793.1 hypothetical protein [Trichomonas vaginalis G3]